MTREHRIVARLLGEHAVVVGAGIGGLAAAGALAAYFGTVSVLERDQLPPSARPRTGTPQDRHPHGLLAGGLRALGSIFPGIEADLAKAGAVPVGVAQDFRWERPGIGALPPRDFGLSVLCATRPLIEHMLRRRVQALDNVELWPEARVTEIALAPAGGSVEAVRFDMSRGRSAALHPDMVVDASGRGALTLAALDAVGWGRPEVTEIGVDIRYASVVVRLPAGAPRDWSLLLTQPDPPALPRNAVMLPAEEDRWMVLLADRGGGARPEDWPSFLEALRGLSTTTLHQALRNAEPPAEIRHYAFPASVWRHFEHLPRLPRGLLPFADALCRFNPVYGQGMSAAAIEARLLRDVLDQAAGVDPLASAQAAFMAAVASELETPWGMAAVADFAFPGTRGERPEGFADGQRFEAALFRAAVTDPAVHRALLEVAQLLRHRRDLQDPDILRRIEAAA
jgi:2-polyprenyl-6-methoxyphenol hydroxylase-like FAD-dependent oxidoreductase